MKRERIWFSFIVHAFTAPDMVYHPHAAPIVRSALHGMVLGLVVAVVLFAPIGLPSCAEPPERGGPVDPGVCRSDGGCDGVGGIGGAGGAE